MVDSNEHATDPRIAHTRHVVRQAALAELGAVGYGKFTIEAVAARSRVAKSTIYRHWDGKVSLIADALETINTQPAAQLGEGTAREQIAVLLHHLVAAMDDPDLSATVSALVDAAERDPTIADFHHRYNDRRRQTLVDVIATGVTSGELDAALEPDLAALALAGPVIYRRFMTGQPFPADRIHDLIDQVIGPSPK